MSLGTEKKKKKQKQKKTKKAALANKYGLTNSVKNIEWWKLGDNAKRVWKIEWWVMSNGNWVIKKMKPNSPLNSQQATYNQPPKYVQSLSTLNKLSILTYKGGLYI